VNVVHSEMTVVPGNPLEVIRTIMNMLPRGNYFSTVVCTVCAKMLTVSPGKPSVRCSVTASAIRMCCCYCDQYVSRLQHDVHYQRRVTRIVDNNTAALII